MGRLLGVRKAVIRAAYRSSVVIDFILYTSDGRKLLKGRALCLWQEFEGVLERFVTTLCSALQHLKINWCALV